MINPWLAFLEASKLGYDVQQVIALRMMRIAAGGPAARAEATRMVSEKMKAFAVAQAAAAMAFASGKSATIVAKRALKPLKRRVRANRRRLSK